MPSLEDARIPDWAKQERAGDLAWIGENLHVFWPVAQQGYQENGRGAIVVDTTSRPTGGGHPFAYLPQSGVVKMNDPDVIRMMKAYDPTWEFVTMIFKNQGRVSTYEVGVPSEKKERGFNELSGDRAGNPSGWKGIEDIIRREQTELLRKADRGLLPCPQCGKPLSGTVLVSDVYQGVLLLCEDRDRCGFYEL